MYFFRVLGNKPGEDEIVCEVCLRTYKKQILNRIFGRTFHCSICGVEG